MAADAAVPRRRPRAAGAGMLTAARESLEAARDAAGTQPRPDLGGDLGPARPGPLPDPLEPVSREARGAHRRRSRDGDGARQRAAAARARTSSRGSGAGAAVDEPWRPLTAREFEVARLIAEGMTNAEIARRARHRAEDGERRTSSTSSRSSARPAGPRSRPGRRTSARRPATCRVGGGRHRSRDPPLGDRVARGQLDVAAPPRRRTWRRPALRDRRPPESARSQTSIGSLVDLGRRVAGPLVDPHHGFLVRPVARQKTLPDSGSSHARS